jgi:adenosine deaminase
MSEQLMSWFQQVPKVELHVHLEGAIPHGALWELLRKYGDESIPDRAALTARFTYRDFPHFLDTWSWKNGFLREADDFTLVAEGCARDLAAQGVRYVEGFYSPSDFGQHGIGPQEITVAIRKGLSRVPGIEVGLIADLVRNYGPERAARTLGQVLEVRDQGVIGIGIGGSEHTHPPAPFAAVYEEARRHGLHTTAHAGEAAGPESMWSALNDLGVERLGHATRAGEDERLLALLVERQIGLEMCPLSNVRTGVVTAIEDHPVRRFFNRGALVTVNTDDPKMFNNSLAEEYETLERVHGFTRDEIRTVILNGIRASWLSEARKLALAAEFTSSTVWAG